MRKLITVPSIVAVLETYPEEQGRLFHTFAGHVSPELPALVLSSRHPGKGEQCEVSKPAWDAFCRTYRARCVRLFVATKGNYTYFIDFAKRQEGGVHA